MSSLFTRLMATFAGYGSRWDLQLAQERHQAVRGKTLDQLRSELDARVASNKSPAYSVARRWAERLTPKNDVDLGKAFALDVLRSVSSDGKLSLADAEALKDIALLFRLPGNISFDASAFLDDVALMTDDAVRDRFVDFVRTLPAPDGQRLTLEAAKQIAAPALEDGKLTSAEQRSLRAVVEWGWAMGSTREPLEYLGDAAGGFYPLPSQPDPAKEEEAGAPVREGEAPADDSLQRSLERGRELTLQADARGEQVLARGLVGDERGSEAAGREREQRGRTVEAAP